MSFAALTVGLSACAFEDWPQEAQVSSALGQSVTASINGWTITSDAQRAGGVGNLRAQVTFDDNDLGGARSGGVCLIADLRLGRCDTAQDCFDAAAAAGLPPDDEDPDWFHYCVATGQEGTPRHARSTRCWSRPGAQGDFCSVGPGNLPDTTRTVERNVIGIPGLPAEPRRWTSLACLAGGTAPDGSVVGNPLGCALQTDYVYAVDRPLIVLGH